jgi:hypothetical protein
VRFPPTSHLSSPSHPPSSCRCRPAARALIDNDGPISIYPCLCQPTCAGARPCVRGVYCTLPHTLRTRRLVSHHAHEPTSCFKTRPFPLPSSPPSPSFPPSFHRLALVRCCPRP